MSDETVTISKTAWMKFERYQPGPRLDMRWDQIVAASKEPKKGPRLLAWRNAETGDIRLVPFDLRMPWYVRAPHLDEPEEPKKQDFPWRCVNCGHKWWPFDPCCVDPKRFKETP